MDFLKLAPTHEEQAGLNLMLNRDESKEIAAAKYEFSVKSGIPFQQAKQLDNQVLEPPVQAKSLPPNVQKYYATSTAGAAVLGDATGAKTLVNIDNILDTWGADPGRSNNPKLNALRNKIKGEKPPIENFSNTDFMKGIGLFSSGDNSQFLMAASNFANKPVQPPKGGYTAKQESELHAAGFKKNPGASFWTREDTPGVRYDTPILPQWYMSPTELEVVKEHYKEQQDLVNEVKSAFNDTMGNLLVYEEGNNGMDGSTRDPLTVMLNAEPGYYKHVHNDAINLIQSRRNQKALSTQLKVLTFLNARFPGWKEYRSDENRAALEEMLGEAKEYVGPDAAGYTLDNIQKFDTWDADFSNAVDILGVKSLLYDLPRVAGGAYDNAKGMRTSRTLDLSNAALEDMITAERGQTLGKRINEGVAGSIGFMVELFLTGGLATAGKSLVMKTAKKGLVDRIKNSVARGLAGEAVRSVAYVPKETLKAVIESNTPNKLSKDETGDIIARVEDKDFTEALTRNVISGFIERYTETLGGAVSVDAVSGLIPLKGKKILAATFLAKASKYAKMARKAGHFDGIPAELGEEAMGNFLQYGVTKLGEATGYKGFDLGVKNPLIVGDDLTVTLASIGAQSLGFGLIPAANNISQMRSLARWGDTLTSINKEIHEGQAGTRSEAAMKEFLRQYPTMEGKASVGARELLVLFQEAPDIKASLGVTPDNETLIKERAEENSEVRLDVSNLVFNLKPDQMQKVMEVLQNEAGGLSMKRIREEREIRREVQKTDSPEAIESFRAKLEDLDDYQQQLQRLHEELAASGKFSDKEIQSYLALVNSRAVTTALRDNVPLAEMVSNLSFKDVREDDFQSTHDAMYAAAAYRRKDAPNEAEKPGNLREARVPHNHMLRKSGLIKKTIRADYEFLRGKHPEYIDSQEHAQAMVRFVLAKPERTEDIDNNLAFVRYDAKDDKYVRVEVSKRGYRDGNHVRSVHVITQQQYENTKSADLNRAILPSQNSSLSDTDEQGSSVADFYTKYNGSNENVNPDTLNQATHKGAIQFLEDGKAIVNLFETADFSTLVHETGHYFHKHLEDLVSRGAASAQSIRDLEALRAYTATEADEVAGKEKLARAFETYIREGKAPSGDLRIAFRHAKALLVGIYRSLKSLNVVMNDDIRQVFDRMLTTDAQIAEANARNELITLFEDDRLLGLTQEERKVFKELAVQSIDQANETLAADKAKTLKKLTRTWRKEAKELMAESQVYDAWDTVKERGGLDYGYVKEVYGQEITKLLRERGLLTKVSEKGESPFDIATAAGYENIDSMMSDLFDAPTPSEFIKEYMGLKEAEFEDSFDATSAALDTKGVIERLDFITSSLAEKADAKDQKLSARAYRTMVAKDLMATPVAQATSVHAAIAAVKRSVRDLTKAAQAGDYLSAFQSAQTARYNLEKLRQARAAHRNVQRVLSKTKRSFKSKPGNMDGDFQYHLQMIALRFEMLKNKPTLVSNTTLSEILKPYEDVNGLVWPEWLTDPNMEESFKNISLEDFEVLGNLVDFLAGEGRGLVKDLDKSLKESIAAQTDEMVATLDQRKGSYHGRKETTVDKTLSRVRTFFAWTKQLRYMLREADDYSNVGKDGQMGPNERVIYERLSEASGKELGLKRKVDERLVPIMKYFQKRNDEMPKVLIGEWVPSVPESLKNARFANWTYDRVLAVAMNIGTEDNYAKLKSGLDFEDADINALLKLLSSEDLKQVQKVWDILNEELWPELKDTFKRVNHFNLRKVEHRAINVETADGTVELKGGYYPVAYDSKVDERRGGSKAAEVERTPNRKYSSAHPSADFTHERKGDTGSPVLLDLSVLMSHVGDTSHYIAYKEAIRDIFKIVDSPKYRNKFREKMSWETYEGMKRILTNIANPMEFGGDPAHNAFEWSRSIAVSVALAYNHVSSLMQLASATSGIADIGVGNYLKGWQDTIGFGIGEVFEMSTFMRNRWNNVDFDAQKKAYALNRSKARRILNNVQDHSFDLLKIMDVAVAIPLWRGAYAHGMDREGGNHEAAVRFADETVAAAQGSGRTLDAVGLQLSMGGRMLTMFYSAVGAIQNRLNYYTKAMAKGKLDTRTTVEFVMAEVILQFMAQGMLRALGKGLVDPEDEEAQKTFWSEALTYPVQGVPVVRDMASVVVNKMVSKPSFRGAPTPVFTFYDIVKNSTVQIMSAFEDEDEKKAMFATAEVVGAATKLPVVPIYRRMKRTYTNLEKGED